MKNIIRQLVISFCIVMAFSLPAQNLFLAELQSGVINQFTPGGVKTTFASGFERPTSVAFNSAGEMFVADCWSGYISKLTRAGGQSTFASMSFPFALAVDAAGNVFVTDSSYNITKITPGGAKSNFAEVQSFMSSLAFNSAGDLFVAQYTNIIKITPAGVQSVFATGFDPRNAMSMAFDSAGNMFVGELVNSNGYARIHKITPIGVHSIFVSSGLFNPAGMAIDAADNILVTDYDYGYIYKFTPQGVQSTFASGLGDGEAVALAIQPLIAPPIITTPPANRVVTSGEPAVFGIGVNGGRPFGFQWQFNGTNLTDTANISGSQSNVLSLAVARAADSGIYSVIVTNGCGVTNATATLTVTQATPVITWANPVKITPGTALSATQLNATANVPGSFAYAPPAGTILPLGTNVLTTVFTPDDLANYNSATGIVSMVVERLEPIITGQPADQVVTNGGTATFSIVLTGTGPFTNQWSFNGTPMPQLISTVAGNGTTGYSSDGGAATNASLYSPRGVAVDKAGNVFIADSSNYRVRKVDTNGIITTVAGRGTSGFSGDGGAATSAAMYPYAVAVDQAGNLFIADYGNYRIRKVDTNGIISTVAGNGAYGYSGDGGAATNAAMNSPIGIAVDRGGNLYIADASSRIRKVGASGIITTFAGNTNLGFSGDGGAATNAALNAPYGVTVDNIGNVFIADYVNNRIRKVNTNGVISTVAGNGYYGISGDGGAATNAWLNNPFAVTVDNAGNLFIADQSNNRVRMVNANGIITTVAGNGSTIHSGDGNTAVNSSVSNPNGLAVDIAGNLLIAEQGNNRIRKMYSLPGNLFDLTLSNINTNNIGSYSVVVSSPYGSVTSRVAVLNMIPYISGQPTGQTIFQGGSASFIASIGGSMPMRCQWRFNGADIPGATNLSYTVANAMPADAGSFSLVVSNLYGGIVSSNAVLSVAYIAKQPTNQTGTNGGSAKFEVVMSGAASFTYQWQLNGTNLPAAGTIITVAGTGATGSSGDGGMSFNAGLYNPRAVALDRSGNLYIADQNNNRIRRVDTNYVITTFAGKGSAGYSGDGGMATNALLYAPNGVALDSAGNLFIADCSNNRIRKVDTNGIITTFAGKGTSGFSGDGNQATNAALNVPGGIAFDLAGNLFIADYGNNRIRKVSTNGIITTFAGCGSIGFSGDGDLATSAMLKNPSGVAVDGAVNLLIADSGNYRIRKVDTNGIISTIAGNGSSGHSGDGGPATSAGITYPVGLALDNAGNLLIADNTYRIRAVWTGGIITTVAGNGTTTYSDGGSALSAGLSGPKGVAVDSTGNIYISDLTRVHKVIGNPVYPPTFPSITIGNLSAFNAGDYSVIIRMGNSSLTSAVATLTVQAPPVITVQPASQIVLTGSSPSFFVGAVGSGPFGYFWYVGGTNLIQGGPANVLMLPGVTTNNAGNYTVVVTNAYGSVTSQVARLTVALPPTIAVQPVSQTNVAGTTVSFGVTPDGFGPFNYQWQINGTNVPNNIITTVVGNGTNGYSGDGGVATNARLAFPWGIAFDTAGNLYIGDSSNQRIRMADTNGIITTVAGKGTAGYTGDGAAATNASLNYPANGVPDGFGNLLIADQSNGRVRKVGASGMITTVLGASGLSTSLRVIPDAAGNLYISDSGANRIYKLDCNGIRTVVAGTGIAGYSGDGGAATNAKIYSQIGMAFDATGNLFFCDQLNNRIRKVDTRGIITTVAGTGATGSSGDGGFATNASLYKPQEVALGARGDLFITDYLNNRIRKVDTNGIITTVAGKSTAGYSGDGGAATNALLNNPVGVAVDSAGNIYVGDYKNNRVRKIGFGGYPTLTLTNVSAANAGTYAVIVSSPYGSVTSSVVSLVVNTPVFVITQPTNQTVAVGGTASFNVKAGGSDPLSYQWYFGNPGLQNTAGAVALTYDGFIVACIVTNGGSGYTTVPRVQVVGGGGAGAGGYATISNGMVVSITMTNAGYGYTSEPTVQIDPPNGLLIGQTTQLLKLNGVATGDAGKYYVIVTNDFGSVTSSVVTLTVTIPSTPPRIITSGTNFGVANRRFGFDIAGLPGQTIVVDASTNLVNWTPVITNAIVSDPVYFSDPNTTNYLERFYRARLQ